MEKIHRTIRVKSVLRCRILNVVAIVVKHGNDVCYNNLLQTVPTLVFIDVQHRAEFILKFAYKVFLTTVSRI